MTGQTNNLRRCVESLVSNAVQHGGGAEVGVAHRPPWVRVRVQDRGPGIPEQALERVFEPFVQLAGTQPQHPGGLGMGLATARTIAQQHGGTLVLRNRPGGGLCAELALPCLARKKAPEGASSKAGHAAVYAATTRTISRHLLE